MAQGTEVPIQHLALVGAALIERDHHQALWEEARHAPPFRPSQWRPPGFFDDFSDLDPQTLQIVGRHTERVWRLFKRSLRMG